MKFVSKVERERERKVDGWVGWHEGQRPSLVANKLMSF